MDGNLSANNKSDLVACLDDFTTPLPDPSAVDAITMDGAAVVAHLIQEQYEHSVTI